MCQCNFQSLSFSQTQKITHICISISSEGVGAMGLEEEDINKLNQRWNEGGPVAHEQIGIAWDHVGAHDCSLDLGVEGEVIVSEDELAVRYGIDWRVRERR